ncbi:hypothetical protein D3C79_1000680 [compost metagenome]
MAIIRESLAQHSAELQPVIIAMATYMSGLLVVAESLFWHNQRYVVFNQVTQEQLRVLAGCPENT